MPRHLNAEAENELRELRLFLETLYQVLVRLGHLGPEAPALLEQGFASVEESHGRSLLLRGTRMAVNDSLEMTRRLPEADVLDLNAQLEQAGAPRLTEMRRRIWRKRVPALLRGGRIRAEEDYYLLVEQLDGGADALSEQERSTAARMLREYEETRGSGT